MKKFSNILIAFDLNKTLFYKCQAPLPRMHDKKIKKLYFYFRPNLKELINYLHDNKINYCFWSNMLQRNCIKYIKQLQQIGMNNYCGIFGQTFCDKGEGTGQKYKDNVQKVKSIKNLNKLASIFQINVKDCILVDDSKQKNVQGCAMFQILPFQGQQHDKQIFRLIQTLKQFRKNRFIQTSTEQIYLTLLKLKTSQQIQYFQLQHLVKQKNKKKQQKKLIISIDSLIENDPQIIKLKSDLKLCTQQQQKIEKQFTSLELQLSQMIEQAKKQAEGKQIKKGDQSLLNILTFAKNKKIKQKRLQQIQLNKKQTERKVQVIKNLIQSITNKLKSQMQKQSVNQKVRQSKQKDILQTQFKQLNLNQ